MQPAGNWAWIGRDVEAKRRLAKYGETHLDIGRSAAFEQSQGQARTSWSRLLSGRVDCPPSLAVEAYEILEGSPAPRPPSGIAPTVTQDTDIPGTVGNAESMSYLRAVRMMNSVDLDRDGPQ
jgi:hypothetical protein